MASVWQIAGGAMTYEQGGAATATTTQATVTAPGSANAKGAWLELIASTANEAQGFFLTTTLTTTASRQVLVDIGLGAASSEVVLLSNHAMSLGAMAHSICSYIPLQIPAGSRVAVRYQRNNTATLTASIYLVAASGAVGYFRNTETWGADTTDSGGTAVTPGQNDAKGSYVQLVAASARDIHAILIHVHGGDFSFAGAHKVFLDIATGAAASETVLIPDIFLQGNSGDMQYRPAVIGPIPCYIPAGSRVAARAQDTDTTVEVFDVSIVAFGDLATVAGSPAATAARSVIRLRTIG